MIIKLNGLWKFTIDMGACGTPYFDVDFPRDFWDLVYVPSVWNFYKDIYYLYEGIGWYVKEFYIEEFDDFSFAEIYFEGVNYICEVYLNGKKIGIHEGGYTPFSFDISEFLKKGRNILVVKVDNRRHLLRMPYVVGWFNYGGIHRPVYIKISKKVKIDAFVLYFEEENGVVDYKVKLKNLDDKFYYFLNIEDENGFLYEAKDKINDFIGKIEFPLKKFEKWFPDLPKTYKLSFGIIDENGNLLDKVEKNFGIRKLKVENYKIFINDKEIKLKGINYLPINPVDGLVFTEEMIKKDLKLIKELNANIIRVHFPLSEEFFNLCDKEGIMVWCDIPVYCLEKYAGVPEDFFTKEENYKLAEQYFKETFSYYNHHPSIITWSIGNENSTFLPGAGEFFYKLVEYARKLEKNRFISYACLILMRNEDESFFEKLDIIGLNEYFGWYDKLGKHYEKWEEKNFDLKIVKEKLSEFFNKHKKPVAITEFGADSLPGFRADKFVLGSEDYHSMLLQESFKIFREFPQITGYFPFSFNDYPDPSKPNVRFWSDQINHKGVVSFNRSKKAVFDTLKKIYENI